MAGDGEDNVGWQGVTGIWLPRVGCDGFAQAVTVIAAANEALAHELHEGNRVQPVATAEDGACRVIWAFAEEIALAVVRGALHLGQRPARIEPVRAQDVVAAGDGGDSARVTFVTPTHFRSGRDHLSHNAAGRRDYLFPAPERIIADLWRKWTALGWPQIVEPNANRIGGRILRYAIAEHWAAGQQRPGFVGTITLDLRPLGPDERASVWALLRFGSYRGVGAHTSYGMGRITVGQRRSPD
jgi:hypothetical protein